VVTGASAGVGRATAKAFAAAGDDVALLARGEGGLAAAARDIEAAGQRALVLPTDTADPDQVERAAARVETELGPIDVWVNDAFASVFAPLEQISSAEFRRVTEVSYLGFVYGTQSALRRMRPRNHGVVVQVGSTLAYRGIPFQSAYCGAKHAVQGFTESVRCELIHDRSAVRITMVQLPAVNTPQFSWVLSRLPRDPQPVPPIYQPEVAARAVLWAAEHDRREWWVGASTAATLLINAIAPGILDRYLGHTGEKSQQTDQSVTRDPQGNLWRPSDASRDFGAHGVFDQRSHARSGQWWLTAHRRRVVGAAALLGVSAAALEATRRR
jgi:NAD(P)-dependent dehydrogenase (short-subunit alcohol dehydrogenase family)